CARDSGDSG
nr:immunoglobulin heavy chain junction region [Homo sapiens]